MIIQLKLLWLRKFIMCKTLDGCGKGEGGGGAGGNGSRWVVAFEAMAKW